jgi:hypothetical protein
VISIGEWLRKKVNPPRVKKIIGRVFVMYRRYGKKNVYGGAYIIPRDGGPYSYRSGQRMFKNVPVFGMLIDDGEGEFLYTQKDKIVASGDADVVIIRFEDFPKMVAGLPEHVVEIISDHLQSDNYARQLGVYFIAMDDAKLVFSDVEEELEPEAFQQVLNHISLASWEYT